MSVLDFWPRRAPGLPPGQREIARHPRFSDKPLRWAPANGPVECTISRDGQVIASFDAEGLARYPRVRQVSDLHCVTTWSYRNLEWEGHRLVDLLADVFPTQPDDDGPPLYAVVTAADRQTGRYLTEDLASPDVLLATHLGGEPLSRRHGAPLRLIAPRQYAYKSAKHVVDINFVDEEPTSSLGAKEHLRARVAAEERHSKLPNWCLRVPYRLSIIPTALAGERGLRNSPGQTPAE